MKSFDGYDSGVKKATWSAVLSSHSREIFPSFGDPRPQSESIRTLARSSVRQAWQLCMAHLNFRPYRLQTMHSLTNRNKEIRLQFCGKFQWTLTEDPDLPTAFLWPMRHMFIYMEQLISRTYDTGQLQILTNSTNAPLWPKIYSLVCCLVQRSYWTLIPWGWRRTSHHSYIAILHRDDEWISNPKASTKP